MSKQIISTTNAPAAIGPYSQAVTYNGLVYTSGQISLSAANGEIIGSEIIEQSHQCMKNLKTVLEAANSNILNVIKTTVFLSSMDDFAAFNKIYSEYFTENFPARSCVAVKTLPKNLLVEIEAIAFQN